LGAAVTFVGCVGDDALGEQTLAGLASAGIDTRFVRRQAGSPSGVALILVDEAGENLIAVAPGANASLTPADVQAAREAFEAADVVVAQLEVPLDAVSEAIAMSKVLGKTVLLNPAPAQPLPEALLGAVGVLTPNELEA